MRGDVSFLDMNHISGRCAEAYSIIEDAERYVLYCSGVKKDLDTLAGEYTREGAYERGKVSIEKEDRKKVFAFEPAPSTKISVCRLLSGIDEGLFVLEFMEWTGEIVGTKGIHLAAGGKALRAGMEKVKEFRAPMILNAVDAATGLAVAQMPIKNKDCEIKAIPELLKLLDIKGSVVTADAVGTQTQVMEQILS